MYELPKYNFNDLKQKFVKFFNSREFLIAVFVFLVILTAGFYAKDAIGGYFQKQISQFLNLVDDRISKVQVIEKKPEEEYLSAISYEQAVINAVKTASPSVVSIVISKNVPVYQEKVVNPFGEIPGFEIRIPQRVEVGKELKQVGSGSGFIVSSDGLILTNKHVVLDESAEYTVIIDDDTKYPAKILAKDPVQDLAVIKIDGDNFPAIKLGNSDSVQVGQTAIAIGNALGKFSNTVSVGVVSGNERTISASNTSGSFSEVLENVIQTDAAINQGNSGGPLLNLRGEVIGVNVANAEGAQAIGFAIPINIAKKGVEQVSKTNKITYPFLGVRYVLVSDKVKKDNNLSVDYGALIKSGTDGEPAVYDGSAAQKAGLKEGDVILEFDGQKITPQTSMAKIIQKYNPGDTVIIKVLRGGAELNLEVTLGER